MSPFILIKSMAYLFCLVLGNSRGHKGTWGDILRVSPLLVRKSKGYERGTNGDTLGGGEKTTDGTQGTHTFRCVPLSPVCRGSIVSLCKCLLSWYQSNWFERKLNSYQITTKGQRHE